MNNNRIVAVSALIVFAITIYVNYMAATGQVNNIATGEVSGMYPTLFTPAGFTFAIWSVIYLLNTTFLGLNLFLVFRKPASFQKKLLGLFTLISVANTGWIIAWHYDLIALSVLIMFGILGTLIFAFKESHDLIEKGFATNLAKVNFAVYLGWISVATIANVSVLLAGSGTVAWSQGDAVWTFVVIGVATILACWLLFRFKSLAYSMVIMWAFYGIYSARSVELSNVAFEVSEAALIGLAVVLVTGGYVFTRKLLSLRS